MTVSGEPLLHQRASRSAHHRPKGLARFDPHRTSAINTSWARPDQQHQLPQPRGPALHRLPRAQCAAPAPTRATQLHGPVRGPDPPSTITAPIRARPSSQAPGVSTPPDRHAVLLRASRLERLNGRPLVPSPLRNSARRQSRHRRHRTRTRPRRLPQHLSSLVTASDAALPGRAPERPRLPCVRRSYPQPRTDGRRGRQRARRHATAP